MKYANKNTLLNLNPNHNRVRIMFATVIAVRRGAVHISVGHLVQNMGNNVNEISERTAKLERKDATTNTKRVVTKTAQRTRSTPPAVGV